MQKELAKICELYSKRRGKLFLERRSQRKTKVGYWAMSNPEQVFELFNRLNLKGFKSFVDLGSGDGVVVAVASLFTSADGIEADASLHSSAVEMRKRSGLKYGLKNADYLEEDLSGYDFIFMNPDNYFYKLEKKLVGGFKGTLVLADNIFRPLTIKPSKTVSVRGTSFSIYTLS